MAIRSTVDLFGVKPPCSGRRTESSLSRTRASKRCAKTFPAQESRVIPL